MFNCFRFSDGVPSGQFESAPWRTKILNDLKKAHESETNGFEKYEVAIEMWVFSWILTHKWISDIKENYVVETFFVIEVY